MTYLHTPHDEYTDPYYDEWDDGPESYITDDGCCSGCGHKLDFDNLDALDFDVEESGVQPATVDGPAVHWANGTVKCPGCKARLPFETSS